MLSGLRIFFTNFKTCKWTVLCILVLIATPSKCHETAGSSDIQTRHFFISRIRIPVHHGRVHSSNGDSSVIAGDSKREPSNSNGHFGNNADAGKAGGDYATNDGLDSANAGSNSGGEVSGSQDGGGRFGGRGGGRYGGRGGRGGGEEGDGGGGRYAGHHGGRESRRGGRGDKDRKGDRGGGQRDGDRDGEDGDGEGVRYGGRYGGRGGRGGGRGDADREGGGEGEGDIGGGRYGGRHGGRGGGRGRGGRGRGEREGGGDGQLEGGAGVGGIGGGYTGGEGRGGSRGTSAEGSVSSGGQGGGEGKGTGGIGSVGVASGIQTEIGGVGGDSEGGKLGSGQGGGNLGSGQLGIGRIGNGQLGGGNTGGGQFEGGKLGGGSIGTWHIGGGSLGGGSLAGGQLGGGNIGSGQFPGGQFGSGNIEGGHMSGRRGGGREKLDGNGSGGRISETNEEGGRGWTDSTTNVGYGQPIDSGRKENVPGSSSQWGGESGTYGSRGDARYPSESQYSGRVRPGDAPLGGGIQGPNHPVGYGYNNGVTFQGVNDQSSFGAGRFDKPHANGATGTVNGPFATYQTDQTSVTFPSQVRCRYVINREDIYRVRNKPKKNDTVNEYEVTDERISGVSYVQSDGSFGPCFRIGSFNTGNGQIPQGTDQYNTGGISASSRNPSYSAGYQGNTQQGIPDSPSSHQFGYQTQVGISSQSTPGYQLQGSNINIFDRPPRVAFTSNGPQQSYQSQQSGVTLPGRPTSTVSGGRRTAQAGSSPTYQAQGSQANLPQSTNYMQQSGTFNVPQVSSPNNPLGGATTVSLPSHRPMETNFQSNGGSAFPQESLGANTPSGGFAFNRPPLGPSVVSISGNGQSTSLPGVVDGSNYQAGATGQSGEHPYGVTFTGRPSDNHQGGSTEIGISYNQPSGASFNTEQSVASHVTFGANRPTWPGYQNQYTGQGGRVLPAGQERGNNNEEGTSTYSLGLNSGAGGDNSFLINGQGGPNRAPRRPHFGGRPSSNENNYPDGLQGSYGENSNGNQNSGNTNYAGNTYGTGSANNFHHNGYQPHDQSSIGVTSWPSHGRHRPQDVTAPSLNGNAKMPDVQYGQHTDSYQKPQGTNIGISVSAPNSDGSVGGTSTSAHDGMFNGRPTGTIYTGSLPTLTGNQQGGNTNVGTPIDSSSGGTLPGITSNIPTIGVTVLSNSISGSKLSSDPVSTGASQLPGGIAVNAGNTPLAIDTMIPTSGGNTNVAISLPNGIPKLSGISPMSPSNGGTGGNIPVQNTQTQMSGGDSSSGKVSAISWSNLGNSQSSLSDRPTNSFSSETSLSGGNSANGFTGILPGGSSTLGIPSPGGLSGSLTGTGGSTNEGRPSGSTLGSGLSGSLNGGNSGSGSLPGGLTNSFAGGNGVSGSLPSGLSGSLPGGNSGAGVSSMTGSLTIGNGGSGGALNGGLSPGSLTGGSAENGASFPGGLSAGSLTGGSGGASGGYPGGISAGSLTGGNNGGGVSLPGGSSGGSGGSGGTSGVLLPGGVSGSSLTGGSSGGSGVSLPSGLPGSSLTGGSIGVSLPGGGSGSLPGISSSIPGAGSLSGVSGSALPGLSGSLPGGGTGGSLPSLSLPGSTGGANGPLPGGLPESGSLPSGLSGSLPGGVSLPSGLSDSLPGGVSLPSGLSSSSPEGVGSLPGFSLPSSIGGGSGGLSGSLPNLSAGNGGVSGSSSSGSFAGISGGSSGVLPGENSASIGRPGSSGSSDGFLAGNDPLGSVFSTVTGSSSNGDSSGGGSGLPQFPSILSGGLFGNPNSNSGNNKPGINITFSNHDAQENQNSGLFSGGNSGGGLFGSGSGRPGGAVVISIPGGQTFVHRFPMRSGLPAQLTPSISDMLDNPETEIVRLKRVDAEVSEITNYKIRRFDKRKYTLKGRQGKMKDRVKRNGFKLHRFRKRPVYLQKDMIENEIPREAGIPLSPIEKPPTYPMPLAVELKKQYRLRTRRHAIETRSSVIQKIGSNPVETTSDASTTSTESTEETTTEEEGSADCMVPVSQLCEMFDDIKDKMEGAKDLAETVGNVVFGGVGGGGGSGGSKGITGVLKGAAKMIPNPFASKS